MPGLGHRRTAVLKGFAPVLIDTARAAHEHSERRFTRLLEFAFSTEDAPEMVSSGPRWGGWSVALVRSTGHRISLGDDDKVSVLFPYRGTIQVQRAGAESRARPDELMIVAPGQRTTWLSAGYLGILIQIPITDFEALQEEEGGRVRRTVEHMSAGSPTTLAAFDAIHVLERDERPLDSASAWHRLVRPIIASAAWPNKTIAKDAGPRALEHVHAAEAFMQANSQLKLSIDDIARACGVRARSLQVAFAYWRRQSPMEALNEFRLQEVLKGLQSDRRMRGITEIALECGFTHLGRFSASYRKFVGERPSRTVRAITHGSANETE